MAQTLCPRERLCFSAEVLTDFFGKDDETLEPRRSKLEVRPSQLNSKHLNAIYLR